MMDIDRITVNPKIHFGKPCVAGTRIPVQSVLELLNEGLTFKQIIQDCYPDLTVEDIQACLRYAIALVSSLSRAATGSGSFRAGRRARSAMDTDSLAPVLVSACLVGVRSRYDGRAATDRKLLTRLRGKAIVPVCPEQLGGLPTPRLPAQIVGGDGRDVLAGRARVVRCDGKDVTREFIRGAREAARLAKRLGVKTAYLKARSPSCGVGCIKSGRKQMKGDGVCAALLRQTDVKVVAQGK